MLRVFGSKTAEAKKAYLEFVEQEINEGRRPELVGGGLIRPVGGTLQSGQCAGWGCVKNQMSEY